MISDNISADKPCQNKHSEYGHPHSNALLHLFTVKILLLPQILVLSQTEALQGT